MEDKILNAEQSCLGAAMLDKAAFLYVMENLVTDNFGDRIHKIIFKSMKKLLKNNMECDIVTLTESTDVATLIEDYGGLSYIVEITSNVPNLNNIEHYVGLVKSAYVKRNKKELLVSVESGKKTIDEALLELETIEESNVEEETFQKILETTLNYTLKGTEHKFSIPALNKYLGGFDKGELLTIGGYTSQGKSGLAIQLAIDFCLKGKKVLFLSTEMLAEEIGRRILGNISSINVMDLRKGMISPEERETLEHTSKKIGQNWKLNIKKIYEIEDAGKYVRKYEPEILILDYIQNLSGEDYKIATRNIKYLQTLTLNKEIATICLSQLNRNKEDVREPRLTDLRDTGRIEEVSNMVIFLYWKERLQQKNQTRLGGEEPEEIEILVSKNRDGTIGRFKMHFYPEFSKFEDVHGEEYQAHQEEIWEKS